MYNFDLSCPYDEWEREVQSDVEIEKEMQNCRKRAVRKFSSIVPHPDYTTRVAISIVYAYRDSITQSADIIQNLDLDDMEIFAIEENFESFKELYIKFNEDCSIIDFAREVL